MTVIFIESEITHRVIFLLILNLSASLWILQYDFFLIIQLILSVDSSHLLWENLLKLSN